MMQRIVSIFLGVLVCSLIAWNISFSQDVGAPAISASEGQTGGSQAPSYSTPTGTQQPAASQPMPSVTPPAPAFQTPAPQVPMSGNVQPSQPQVLEVLPPYAAPVKQTRGVPSMEPLSPFEQYVAGVIPTEISFDIKQFGYDLFYSAPSTFAPTMPQGTQGQPFPSQIYQGQGQIAPPQGAQGQLQQGIQGQPPQFSQGQISQGMQGQIPQGMQGQFPQGMQGQPPQGPQRQPAQGTQWQFPQGMQGQQIPYGQLPQQQQPFPTPAQRMQLPSISDVPVGPNYVLGPGDEIRITVWGSVEGSWDVAVDRDGNINLPKAGVLGVTGLTFQELKELLNKEMSKYYKDFEMNVSLGQLRTIRIYLVGNARTPGTYTVSSLSTIINALVVAGGPSKSGSMRDIQLKRNGETVAHLDLYDFLIRGDKTKDVRLMAEDVIFIPPIGQIVGVAGDVSRPAIYELKTKARINDIIKLAGGTTASSYLQRVQVERVKQRQSKMILDLNLQNVKGKDDIYVEDGDIVKIFSINALVANKVMLQGNVKRPGDYQWSEGMRVGDLIQSADGLLPNTLFDFAIIQRVVPPDYHPEYTRFSLDGLLFRRNAKDNIKLEPNDIITVYNKSQIQARKVVRIRGAVNRPGDFEFRDNMRISDLVNLAGGIRRFAFTRQAELTRTIVSQEGPRTERMDVNLAAAVEADPAYDITLLEDDFLMVKTVPDWELYRKVVLAGEVMFPGEYPLEKGEKLSSLIRRAGGYTDKAYLRGAHLTRLSIKAIQQVQINDMVNRLERELNAVTTADMTAVSGADDTKAIAFQGAQKKALMEGLRHVEAKGRMVIRLEQPDKLKGTPYDITMEEGDNLFVPATMNTVQVVGAVYNSTSFLYSPKKDYSYYIQSAGGYSRTANKSEVYIVKVDGTAIKPNRGWLSWNTESNQWVSGAAGVVEPGDTIIVPDNLESKWAWLPRVKDLTTILYQIGLGAGILLK